MRSRLDRFWERIVVGEQPYISVVYDFIKLLKKYEKHIKRIVPQRKNFIISITSSDYYEINKTHQPNKKSALKIYWTFDAFLKYMNIEYEKRARGTRSIYYSSEELEKWEKWIKGKIPEKVII